MKLSMSPENGWLNYDGTKNLDEFIWNSLQIKEHGGSWDYFNFTSNSSFWTNGDYSLTLQFINEDCEQISSLELNVPDNKNTELNFLIQQFKVKFGLLSKYC